MLFWWRHMKEDAWIRQFEILKTVDKNLRASAEDTGSIPGLGRSHIPWGN